METRDIKFTHVLIVFVVTRVLENKCFFITEHTQANTIYLNTYNKQLIVCEEQQSHL